MRTHVFAIALLAMLGAAPLSAEEPQNVAGTWHGKFTRLNGNLNGWDIEDVILVLAQVEHEVTGTLNLRRVEGPARRKTREDFPV